MAGLAFLGASHAFADERHCRQLEAQLATAASSGDSAQYGKYDRAITAQSEQLSKARGQARSMGCSFSRPGAERNRCASLNITIERMKQNLAALQSQRSQLAEGGNSWTEQARLTASLDANGCRDSAMMGQNGPPPMEEGGSPSLEQLLDDDMEQEAFPEEEASGYARHVVVPGPMEEPDSAEGRARLGGDAAASALEQPHAGSIITLGAPPATTKLPPPGERKVRVVGPVFLPDPEASIFRK
jgi:hypothetical protein